MKSGKDEERSMGPLFPRLHVNDTEKGGPRAPPRNKMALYEQLSIPSQRFNSGSGSTMPVPQNNNTSNNMGSPASASLSQGGGHERTVFSPYYIPPMPTHLSEEHLRSSVGEFLKTVTPDFEGPSAKNANYRTLNAMGGMSPTAECSSFRSRNFSNSKNSYSKKIGDDEDFMVPTFVQSGIAPGPSMDLHNRKYEIMKAASAACSSSMQLHSLPDKYLKRPNTTDIRSRQHVRNQIEENPKEATSSKDRGDNNPAHPSTTEKIDEQNLYASSNQRHHNIPVDDLRRLDEVNEQAHPESGAAFMPENNASSADVSDEPVVYRENVNVSRIRNESCSRASFGNGHRNSTEYCEDRNGSLQVGDADRNDDASETSMVDSISALDISPDDVVGVIGQKHFWKARTAIANQQRLFSVQVFELHRLIKVQKVFAGSPHLLLENNPYLSKSSPKPSPARELPSEYVLKSVPQIVKRKSDSLKPNKTTECTAENAVGKPPLPSVSDIVDRGLVNQHSGYGPYSETPPAAPVVSDNQQGWCFPPPGNQWLVPVMSPSEGLIYKPFAGPCPPAAGFMAPIYGGCLPPAYGLSSSHPPGMGLLPSTPVPQNYFPHYRMPVMSPVISSSAVEQVSPFPRAPSHGQTEQLSNRQVNVNSNSRNSCNMSNQKSEALSRRFSKIRPSKESELQGSTASSPCDRAGNASQSRDALPLFPTAPAEQARDSTLQTHSSDQQYTRAIKVVPHNPRSANESAEQARDSTLQTHSSDQQYTRAIKVVPHNPRSANESAARIFRSIQEERQQHD